jgi:hypothetical protein
MTTSYHLRPLCTILILAVTLGVGAVDVSAGTNPNFRIVLHAKQSSFEPCNGYLPVNCVDVPPTVNLPSAAPTAVFVLLFNYTAASGIQTGFEWPGWSLTFSLWDCGILNCDFAPCNYPNPPGPMEGILEGDFIGCVTGPALKVIGRMHFVPAGSPGCISQFIPDLPNGIHLRDCTGGVDLITDASSPRLGKICVGLGGVNACESVVPVESSTWGNIKATY